MFSAKSSPHKSVCPAACTDQWFIVGYIGRTKLECIWQTVANTPPAACKCPVERRTITGHNITSAHKSKPTRTFLFRIWTRFLRGISHVYYLCWRTFLLTYIVGLSTGHGWRNDMRRQHKLRSLHRRVPLLIHRCFGTHHKGDASIVSQRPRQFRCLHYDIHSGKCKHSQWQFKPTLNDAPSTLRSTCMPAWLGEVRVSWRTSSNSCWSRSPGGRPWRASPTTSITGRTFCPAPPSALSSLWSSPVSCPICLRVDRIAARCRSGMSWALLQRPWAQRRRTVVATRSWCIRLRMHGCDDVDGICECNVEAKRNDDRATRHWERIVDIYYLLFTESVMRVLL